MAVVTKEAKTDCFAYARNDLSGKYYCNALDKLYCALDTKKCPFYKPQKNGDKK